MKHIFKVLLIAAFLFPIRALAATEIRAEAVSNTDGVFTGKIIIKVGQGESITELNSINLIAHNAIIKSIESVSPWIKIDPESTISETGASATIKLSNPEFTSETGYVGTGEDVVVAEVKYVHDSSYKGTEKCNVDVGFAGDTTSTIVEKTTTNADTGSILPYAGIVAGVALIAVAYVISRKSNKLYKI